MKWKSYLLIVILIILGLVIFITVLNVQAVDNSIYYTFENDYLYDDSLPEMSNDFNVRNKTAGHYNATYSFENDSFIELNENDIGCTSELLESYYNHYTVLNLTDNSDSGYVNIRNYVLEHPIVGIIEFWYLTDDISINSYQYLYFTGYDQSGQISFRISFCYQNGNTISYSDGSSWFPIFTELLAYQWFHIRIDFDYTIDKCDVYINNQLLGNQISYVVAGTYLSGVYFTSRGDSNGNIPYSHYIDAIGYSWDKTDLLINETYYIDTVDMHYGTKSVLISNSYCDDESYFLLTSEWVETAEAYYVQTENLGFNVEPYGRYAYFSYDIVSSLPNTRINVNDVDWKIGSPNLDADNQLHLSVNDVYIWAGSGSAFTLRVYYFELVSSTYIYHYEIGDNWWISEMIPTNQLEVDKFEFVSNSTSDFYDVGTNIIEGWDISESDGFIEIANDGGLDNSILFDVENKGCYSTMNRSFDVFTSDDYIEFGFKMTIDGWSYSDGANKFYIYLNDTDNDVLFKFYILTSHNSQIVYLANAGEFPIYHLYGWSVLSHNYYIYSDNTSMTFYLNLIFYNGTCSFNYSDNIDYSDFPISEPLEQYSYYNDTSFNIELDVVKFISFINTWSIILNHIYSSNFYLDYIYLYVNGESISTELYPENVYLLSTLGVSLLEYNFLEITFNNDGYDNNVSIYINDDIHIIDYNDYFYDNVYFINLYSDADFYGFYLRIYNGSTFEIINIKLSGVKLHNEFTSEKYLLEFDYQNINITDSYFYADDDNNLRFKLNITNDDLEYIQATFDVENIGTYDKSFIYTYSKTGLGEGYLRLNYIDDTSTILYLTDYMSSNNVLLPQDKVIDSFIILFSDNDDFNDGYTYGFVDSFVLSYTSDYSLTIITVALMDTIIGLLVIILPSFLFSIKLGKKSIIPFMSIMSVTCYIFGLIPMWLFFILMLCFGALLMIQYKGDDDIITT